MADDIPFMGSLTKEDLDLAREVGIDTSKYTPESALTREGYRPVEQADYETSWSDYGRAITSGGAGVVSGLAGGAEYLTGGALGGDTRRYFGEISDEQVKAMSPAGRRAIQAEFLPEQGGVSVFENLSSSLGLKTVSALPSLVASIIPAGIAVKALQGASLGARALGAGVATRGTAGLMAGGDVAGQIYSEVEKLSDKDLQAKSELYAGYRSMMPEADARRQFMQEVAGAAPAAAALISAAIGGAEGQVAGRLAGKAATGVLRGVGQGARAEAAQETAESGVGELLAQLALTDQNLAQMNWQKILSKGLEGATIGGIMGGGVGGISGIGGRADAGTLTATSDPDAIKKLMEAEQAPETESQGVVPPKGYGTGTAPAPAEDPTAGNPQSQPSGSERQYPKGKTPPFTIDTVRSRLEAKGIEFPEDRLQEIEGRISEIRKMKVGKRGAEYGALLKSLYPAETTVATQTIAPGVSVGAGPDEAQTVALSTANPVQPVAPEAAPQPPVMAPVIPPPVADALGNLTTPRAPAPAPEPPAPAPAPAPIPPPVAAAVQKQTAAPAQSEVQPISDNSGGWNYIKFGNAQVELQKDGIGWKPTDGQSTIFYATGKGPGTRRRGEAHLSGMAKAGVPAEVMPIFTDYANGKIGKDQVLEQLRGLEAKFKQRQVAAPKAPVDTGTNLQQPAADLLAEQEELISGQRAVQMFPTNTTPLKLPKGMKKSKTSRGVFHYNPDAMLPNGSKVTEGLIQRLSAMGRENELLGLGDRTKQEVAAAAPAEGGVTTVNEVTPAGDTVKSVATTVADADRQAQMLSENAAPENKVEIKPTAQALAPRVSQDVTYKGRNVVEDLVQKQREEEEIARRNAELDRLEQASEARRQDKVAKDTSDKELQVDEPRFLTRMRKIKKALGENAPEGVDKAIQLANQRKALGSGKSQKKIDITKQIRALQKIELEQRTTAQTSSEGTANVPAITRGTQVAEAPKPKKLGRPKKNPVAGTEEESAEAEIARLIREQKQEKEYDRKGVDKRALGSGGMREEETQREISDERDAGGTIGEDEAGRDTQEAFDIEPSVEVSDVGYGGEQAGRATSAAEEKAFEDRIKKNGELTNKIQALLDDDAATEGQKAVARVQLKRLKKERNDLMQEREDAASDVEVKKAEEERQARLRKAREEGYEPVAPTKAARVVEVSRKRAPIKGKPDLKPKAAAAVAVSRKAEPTSRSVYETGKAFVANVYHGTTRIYERMSAEFLGTNTKAPSAEQAFFFTDTPSMSNVFAGVPDQRANVSTEEILEYAKNGPSAATPNLRTQLQTLTDDQADRFTKLVGVISKVNNPELVADKIRNLLRESDPLAAQRDMARLRMEDPNYDYAGSTPRTVLSRIELTNPLVVDFEGARSRPSSFATTIENAKRDGHDGVVLKNVWDGGELGNVFAVFDENQISDRFQPQVKTDVIESSNVPMDGDWTDAYVGLDPNRKIVYSDDTIALMSARAQNGKTIYVPIHRTDGYAKVDIDAFDTGKLFTQEQADRLKAAKQADVDLREAGRPANAIKFPNGEYIVPESTISLAEALNGLDLTGLSDTFSIIRDRVIRDVRNVPVHIVSPAEIAKASGRSTDLGFYSYSDATGEHILVRNDLNTDSNLHTVVHEAVHALVMRSMKNNVTLNNLAVAVANEVTAYWKSKNGIDIRDMPFARYAYKNIDEFMSEAWGNREFQDLLAKTPISPALAARLGIVDWRKSTMWDAVIKFVQRTLKLPNNAVSALEAVMRVTDEAASGRAGLKPSTMQAAPLQSANITAQGIIGSSVDRKNAYNSWFKRNWAKFITGGQMRQQYADTVIGPALAKIWEGVSATGPRIQQIKAEGDALATRAIDLSNKNPTEFRSLVQIMEEARMMNVNIEGANAHLGKDATKGWQAKGRLGDLQSRFAQIRDGELKQLYRDMAAYYRDSHNAIVKSSVTSILEGLELRQARGKAKGNALSEQQITDLTKRVMDQEMTAADKALLGVTVFNALKNAAAFHRIQGDYFPLMRYGDHVVTTTDKIRDTMGGKLEEPDTVLFRDKSNTSARRAAENFVKKSELVHLSTEKVFIDNATGKEVSEDDAKSLNDVDIGYRVTMQTKGVYFFETGKAAEEFARTNPEGHDTVSNPEIRMGSGYQAQIMTGTQVASLNSAIDGRVKTGDITDGQAALLKSIVNQAATRMLGGNRIASRRLKSQKVTGASSDVARNLLQYNSAAANHIAVAENAPAIRDGLTEMTEALKGYAGNDRAQLVAVAEEVKARVDQGIVDPNAPGKVMKDIMALSFLARLFSPAYNVINGMQPWMVTLPILGGRFGNVAASAAMGRAYSDIGFGDAALQGVMNTARATQQAFKAALIGTDDIVGNIRKKVAKADDGADLTRMMDELIRQNAIDVTAGFEVAASAAEGRGWRGKTLAGVDRIARQLPQVVEAVNRSVSAIAAYRLARQNNQTHEQATQFALNTVQNTQGDYSAANAPRFFNNPILRPALQFKKYAQMMTYLLSDMAYRAFNGATPEEKRIALKQIGNILAVQMLMAGALGLPGLEIIKAGFLLASFAGVGGGWDEVEEKLRKLLDDSVGKGWGEMISSGILSRAIGIDVSQRMSLADMWLFGEPKGDTSESIEAYLFRQVVGAPGSLLLDARNGLVLAVEGEWGKAAGKLIPIKFAADFAKAAHNSSESEYEKADKKKVSGPGEFALNVFGFRSGRQAELGRTTGADIKEKRDTQKEFKKLQKAFYGARTKGDQIKAIARNREWNDSLSKAQWRLRLPVTPRELRTAQ